jgi:hypothetical protein
MIDKHWHTSTFGPVCANSFHGALLPGDASCENSLTKLFPISGLIDIGLELELCETGQESVS